MADFFTTHYWLFWLLASVLCLILEVSSGTFYILCFAIGAFGGIIGSLLGIPFWSQVMLFAIVTAVSIFSVRPLAIKYLHRGEDKRESNADALIGRTATVIETIGNENSGYVKVDGDEWRAVSHDGSTIETGAKVQIMKMESIIVTVRKIEN